MLKTLESLKLSNKLNLERRRTSYKQKTISRDCLQTFLLHSMHLITFAIVENSHIVAGIYFIFLEEPRRPNLKVLQYQIWNSAKILNK